MTNPEPAVSARVHREIYERLPLADLEREIAELQRFAATDDSVARKLIIAIVVFELRRNL